VLIAIIPFVAELVPPSLLAGRFSTSALSGSHPYLLYSLVPFVTLLFRQRELIAPFLLLCVIGGGLLVKGTDFPVLDRTVSARGLWARVKPIANQLCDAGTNRDWIYGLSFYRGSFIGYCPPNRPALAIRSTGHGQPEIVTLP
jgi:hypothetical protein